MKTKKYFTLVISVFLILCLIFNGLLDRKNQDLQKGIDEALTLNLISIDKMIDQDTEKLKVFKLYFDETKFTDYWKKNYTKYDTQLRTIHAIAKSSSAYQGYDLKKLRYYLFDLYTRADAETLTKTDLELLLKIFEQWQYFPWEQLDKSCVNGSQREYYNFKNDDGKVKDSIQKVLDLIQEDTL